MSKELATTNQSALAMVNSISAVDEYGDIKAEEIRIPRVTLLQPMSPECQEDGATLRPGNIIDSVSKSVLGEIFVPLKKLKTTYCLFNGTSSKDAYFDAAKEPRSLIYSATDKNDPNIKPYLEWGKDKDGKTVPPIAKEAVNFLVLFHGETLPKVLAFTKTNHKQGIAFFNMLLQFKGKERLFQRKYSLKSKKVQKDGNTWFEYDIKPAGVLVTQQGEVLDEFIHEVVATFGQYATYDPSDDMSHTETVTE